MEGPSLGLVAALALQFRERESVLDRPDISRMFKMSSMSKDVREAWLGDCVLKL
jgi:hypothetical protein